MKFEREGLLGTITCSKISHGQLNRLLLEVDCSEGSISWEQEDPDKLMVRLLLWGALCSLSSYAFINWHLFLYFFQLRKQDQPLQILTAGASYNKSIPTRLPAAHPEGYIEALANIYNGFYDDLASKIHDTTARSTELPSAASTIYPNLMDGVEGMAFIETCISSSKEDGKWIDFM